MSKTNISMFKSPLRKIFSLLLFDHFYAAIMHSRKIQVLEYIQRQKINYCQNKPKM